MKSRFACSALICVTGMACTFPAPAEIVSLAGSVEAQIIEYYIGKERDSDNVYDVFPETSAELPLQVVARLVSPEGLAGDLTEEAAASVGAQFADPRTVSTPNPEEFAINLALHSISPHIHYEAQASSCETRGVNYAPGELGLFARDGDAVQLIGRLFLDGALTLFAADADQDLTGAYVRLNVTVWQYVEEQDEKIVFEGAVELTGTANGEVEVNVDGDFPTNRLVLSDLSVTASRFDVFRVLILPNMTINYNFDAVVGQEFTLEACVDVEAANLPNGIGVAAILGTPTDTLIDVIDLTTDAQTASQFVSKITEERANPTGDSVFPAVGGWPFLPACGVLGMESVLGFVALAGFRATTRRGLVIRK